MKIINKINLKYNNIALAYSGGLDTTTALKWLKKKGIKVFSIFVNINNENIKKIKKKALLNGSYKFVSLNCKKNIIKEAFLAIGCRAFNIYCGTGIYFNTTPIGRAVIVPSICKYMKKKNIKILSDGSTYKGNDIERFFLYSYINNKNIKIYKPWLDRDFIKEFGGRKEMSKFSKSKNNYSIDSNILGNTYEGGDIENIKKKNNINFILKNKKKKKYIVLNLKIKNGVFHKFNNKKIINKFNFFKKINKICSQYNLGITDQIEERIIGIKSRGIYEAPAMFLFHNIFERAISIIYKYDSIKLYRENGIRLGELLYKGLWYCGEAEIRKKIGEMFYKKINGKIKVSISTGNIKYIYSNFKNSLYKVKNSTMEKSKNKIFNYSDRIGYLNISKLNYDNDLPSL